jgi:hypothetical protein
VGQVVEDAVGAVVDVVVSGLAEVVGAIGSDVPVGELATYSRSGHVVVANAGHQLGQHHHEPVPGAEIFWRGGCSAALTMAAAATSGW